MRLRTDAAQSCCERLTSEPVVLRAALLASASARARATSACQARSESNSLPSENRLVPLARHLGPHQLQVRALGVVQKTRRRLGWPRGCSIRLTHNGALLPSLRRDCQPLGNQSRLHGRRRRRARAAPATTAAAASPVPKSPSAPAATLGTSRKLRARSTGRARRFTLAGPCARYPADALKPLVIASPPSLPILAVGARNTRADCACASALSPRLPHSRARAS